MRKRSAAAQRGFTLVEIMVAMVMLAVCLLAMGATAGAILKQIRGNTRKHHDASRTSSEYEKSLLITPTTPGGFSAIELLVALIIAGAIVVSALVLLNNNQRLFAGISDVMGMQGQLRDGEQVLASELRSLSPHGDTIRMMSDSAIEFFSNIGTSVLCSTPTGATLYIPPESLATNTPISSWQVTPDTGDIAVVYEDSSALFPNGRWLKYRISSFSPTATSASCIQSSKAHLVTLSSIPANTIKTNAPIRFIRRGRYSLYKSSADNAWYLGYRRCNAIGNSVCGTVQPVSGPYRSYSNGGLRFVFKDSTGNALSGTANAPRVAQIEVVLRSETDRAVNIVGANNGKKRDSVLFTSVLRNRAE